MKRLFHILALLSIVCVLIACNNQANKAGATQTNKMAMAAWLTGSWKNASADGVAFEQWRKENDSTYSGRSFFVKGADTIPQESFLVKRLGEDVFFIPTVNGQNGGRPVQFRMTSGGENEMVFENPAHDFPQKITYTRVNNDSLLAVISGTNSDRKSHSEYFPMSRVK